MIGGAIVLFWVGILGRTSRFLGVGFDSAQPTPNPGLAGPTASFVGPTVALGEAEEDVPGVYSTGLGLFHPPLSPVF